MAFCSDVADDVYNALLASVARELVTQRLTLHMPVPLPGAGNEFVAKVPGGTRWKLLSVQAILTASAAVANRRASLIIKDSDGNTIARFINTITQTATLTLAYSWIAGMGQVIGGGPMTLPLPAPPFILPSGWTIASDTAAMDVGDTYSGVFIRAEVWSETDVIQDCDIVMQQMLNYLAPHTRSG